QRDRASRAPCRGSWSRRPFSQPARGRRERAPVTPRERAGGSSPASVAAEVGEGCSRELADYVERSKLFAEMARPRSHKRAPVRIDEADLAAFRAGMRRRYS